MNINFTWDDGVADYATTLWLPNVEAPYEVRGQMAQTLDVGALWITQERGGGEMRAPRAVTFRWEVADPDFLPLAEATFLQKRPVTAGFPRRIGDAQTRWTPEEITGYVTAFEPASGPGRTTGLRITVQEVRV